MTFETHDRHMSARQTYLDDEVWASSLVSTIEVNISNNNLKCKIVIVIHVNEIVIRICFVKRAYVE